MIDTLIQNMKKGKTLYRKSIIATGVLGDF